MSLKNLILDLVDTGSCWEIVVRDILYPEKAASRIPKIDVTEVEILKVIEGMVIAGELRRERTMLFRGPQAKYE